MTRASKRWSIRRTRVRCMGNKLKVLSLIKPKPKFVCVNGIPLGIRTYTVFKYNHNRFKWFQDATVDASQRSEELIFAGVDNGSSKTSAYCSNKVLDGYTDGEQHQEGTSEQINTNARNQPNISAKKPPRFRYAAPTSPSNGRLTKQPRSLSFRDQSRESRQYMSTRDWVENVVAHGSPRKGPKQVVKRHSQSYALPRVDSKEFDHDIPMTLEDVYYGSQEYIPRDETGKKSSSSDELNCGINDDCNKVSDYEESEAVDEITLLKAELESRTPKLEKEKNKLKLTVDKELDRRSTEWSMKLEKYKMEEHGFRERVRELTEQDVSLQREVSVLGEKELEEVLKETQNLHQNLSQIKDKCRVAEEDRDLFKRNFEAKDKECKGFHKSITRLVRTCSEQDKTIEGLRESLEKEARNRNFDQFQQSKKMQIEQLRLTGVEQSLRREVESYRLEVDSLRHENINLLNRLTGSSEDGCFSTYKLDQELQSRIHCLQNQGMCLINDSVHLCSSIIESIKERGSKNGLDSHFIMESEMIIQGFKGGAESLARSMQNVADVLQEKSTLDNKCSEDVVNSDLKAEALLTSLLKEKLYSKEMDVERLEAELAIAVRGNDILRCEVQNAMDNLSCIIHKMKDLEIQVIKKEESIYHLQTNLQDCRKELSIINGILPKVSEERDILWENVKQYSENNMLLTSENITLKKKIETLDEDLLMKDGQISILKDALEKPFDLLSSPISSEGFLLR